ncbi:MAG: hydroxymethylbilane synthase [Micrococcales bacterium]
MTKFRVGTRGSLLALTQTRLFTSELLQSFAELELEEVLIQTQGDISTEPLSESKTPGLFVSALREALLENRVDFIIHSMKDLPANPYPGIATACVPVRQDPRDGLVSRQGLSLNELPGGSLVGTSSPRRAASIRRARPDLYVTSIRGNVDTRIAKVERGEYDATLLAMAGLNRISRADAVCQIFDAHHFVPAAGQGALAIECREEDTQLIEILSSLDHAETRLITTAERAVLSGLNAGCATAIGAVATYQNGLLKLTAELAVEQTGAAQRVDLEQPVSVSDLAAARTLGLQTAQRRLESPLAKEADWS